MRLRGTNDLAYFRSFVNETDKKKFYDVLNQDGLVHVRIQQRNGRKTLTTVQGLSKDYDLKRIVRACKKVNLSAGYSIAVCL
jgi:translation initiation factor 1